jgi:GGDEF domain-containing protein
MPSPFDLAQSLLNQDDAPGDQTSGVSPWHAAQAALADEPASAPAQPAASPTWNAAKVASDTFDIGYRGPTSAEIALHDKFADPEFAATAEAQYERDTKRAAQAKQNAILKSEGVGRFADAAQTKARLEKSWLGKVPIVGDALVSGATGVASGLMDLGSTATNLVGADEVSKDLRTRSQTANAADAARYEPDSVTGWLAARTRNLGNAAPKMALGGGTGGGAAIFGLDGATDAAQAADDAGVTGASKYTYVASVGAMNALQSVIFGKLFAGAKSVPKAELMSALKSHGAEILKGTMGNFAVGTVDHLAARLAGVDKTEWTPEELVHDGVNALGDAGAIHGAGMAARAADLARTSPNAAEAILAGEPSRSTFEQAGLGDIKSKPDREAFQNALREVQPSERQQRISENIATHAKPTESMTPEDMKKALLTHPLTGIPNGRAYSEAPKKPIQVQMDIEGLKYFNDNVGKVLGVGDTAGDEVLRAAARAIHDEVDDSYNTHGDTFIAQFDTHEEKAAAMAAAEERLRDAEVDVHMPDGSVKTFKGIGVAWGEGDTLDKAHGDMEADKVRRVDSGKRAPRGEAPRSLVEVPAQGGENSSGQTPTAQEAPAQPGGESPEARSSAAASASPEGVAGHAELNARAKELGLAVGGLSKSAKQERIDTVEHFGSGLPLPSEVHDISRGALRQAVDFMLGRGGESAPLTTKGDRAAGESVAAHAASKGAAKPIADSMYSRIMGEAAGSDKAAHDIGALLSEGSASRSAR